MAAWSSGNCLGAAYSGERMAASKPLRFFLALLTASRWACGRLSYLPFLLKNGDSVLEAMQRDPDGEYLPALVSAEDQSYAMVPEAALRSIAFHDVDETSIQHALPRMAEKQATQPFMAKVAVSDERFGSVPKTYIRTTDDKITSPALQDEMVANWEVDTVHVLASGLFPALSMPQELASSML